MPARKKKTIKSRRAVRHKKKNGSPKGKKYAKLVIGIVVLVLIILGVSSFNTRYWSKDNKLSLVFQATNLDIKILVFDPEVEKITTVVIPADTQIEVSRQLGVMRIKNVWQLGENEGFDGKLLAESVTKNFKIPVVAWASSTSEGFASKNYLEKLKSTILPYKTNLTLGDKIMIGIFSFKVKDFKNEEIDLVDTTFINKNTLKDGGEGFTVTGTVPKSLIIVMSDNLLAKGSARLSILDATGKGGIAYEFGEIMESMGAKVTSVEKMEKENIDCIVVSKNIAMADRISLVFGCEIDQDNNEGNFDIQIKIGEEFAKRL